MHFATKIIFPITLTTLIRKLQTTDSKSLNFGLTLQWTISISVIDIKKISHCNAINLKYVSNLNFSFIISFPFRWQNYKTHALSLFIESNKNITTDSGPIASFKMASIWLNLILWKDFTKYFFDFRGFKLKSLNVIEGEHLDYILCYQHEPAIYLLIIGSR